jgi:uncharacterized membrane protein HdeD (DUF308 family)
MHFDLARNWWALAVRGIAAVIFGLSALFWPPAALVARVLVFAAYALVDGILSLVAATPAQKTGAPSVPVAIEGGLSLIAGVIIIEWPGLAGFPLVLLIAAWLISRGTAEVLAAVRLGKRLRRNRLLALAGVLSLAGGVLSLAASADAVTLVTTWIGAYAVAFGAIMIGLSLCLRGSASLQRKHPGQGSSSAATRMGVVVQLAEWRSASHGSKLLLVATGSPHRPNVT